MVGQRLRMRAKVVRVRDLSPDDRSSLWTIYDNYYEGVSRDQFDRDLDDKQHVIIVHNQDGRYRGFSTLRVDSLHVEGRRVIAVFSGDTVLEHEAWGHGALQNAFGRYISRVRLSHPFIPVYWFLVSKGYRTYLLLARNFPDHWPRHDRPTPANVSRLIETMARERYGPAWRPDLGVIRHEDEQARLRSDVAPLDTRALSRPEVRFFVQANPGHEQGDEMACVGRITIGLWFRYLIKRGRKWARRSEWRTHQWAEPSGP